MKKYFSSASFVGFFIPGIVFIIVSLVSEARLALFAVGLVFVILAFSFQLDNQKENNNDKPNQDEVENDVKEKSRYSR